MSKFKVGMAVMAVVMALSVSAVALAQTPNPPATADVSPRRTARLSGKHWPDKLGVTVETVQQECAMRSRPSWLNH